MYNLGEQFLFDMNKAKANPAVVFKGTNYRISILTERLIRIEYNKSGLFIDTPTELVLCRNFGITKMDVNQDNNYLEVKTKYFKLSYAKEKNIAGSNLKVNLNGTESVWYYGHPEVRTYNASVNSLDSVVSKYKFKKGIYSSEGFSTIDDSNTLLIDTNGNFIKRPSEGIDIYLFMYGNDYQLALNDYFSLSGRPLMIPRYALGNWWSKNYPYEDKTIDKLFDRFYRESVPISVLLFDYDWHIIDKRFNTGFTFDKKLIKNPSEFINKMHERGIRTGLNINPIGGIYPYEENYSNVLEYSKTPVNKTIAFAPYNPTYLDILLKLLLHPLENYGNDFFWLDYNHKDKQSLFVLSHFMYLDSGRKEDKRSMLISKNSNVASHRYGILDSGRTDISFDTLKYLPYVTSSGANIGLSWWSHDIGGFSGGKEDSELYLRYLQYGCFSPIFRIHVDGGRYYKREPWRWDIKTFQVAKEYMQLRHKLVPYIYSEAYKYYDSSIPLIKPLYYTNKEMYYDPLYKNEYYFGSEFLVSPLTDKKDILMNRVIHKFFLPEGTWYDFKTGKKFPGGRSYVSFFKDEDYPVFVKSGSIIPMDADITNGLSLPTNLEINIFPGMSNSYQLFEDDGISNLYKNGYYLKTLIDYNHQASNYTVIIRSLEGKSGIVPPTRNYKIRFRNTRKTDTIIVNFDGRDLPYNSYEDEKDFIVEVNDIKTIGQLTINCKGKAIELDTLRLINEDIDEIISDLEVDTFLKDKIGNILFSNLTIKKKRIEIRKLKKDKLDIKFIKMFLRLLEYIEQI